MITKFLIFFAGALTGLFTMALAAAAGDAERCDECCRMREELEREGAEQIESKIDVDDINRRVKRAYQAARLAELDKDLGVPFCEVNGKNTDCPWR